MIGSPEGGAAGFDYNAYQRQFPWGDIIGYVYRWPIPSITCADGFNMSVQCSSTHYCTPRESKEHFYSSVEVGFPSAREETLMPYAENRESPTQTVYGWVPVGVVEAIVDAHGGVALP